jgi:hypothetical protein
VLIAGGTSNGVPQVATDIFVPAQFPDPYSWGMGSFAPTGALAQPRARAVGAPHIDGYSVVIGGGASDAEVYRFATLKTDADDYAPGTRAVITGAGWEPNTGVTLLFQEDPAVHDDYVLNVTADAEGKIYWDQWAPEPHDLNVRFYLLGIQRMADGSERRAQITFTDSNPQALAVAAPTSVSVVQGATAVFGTLSMTVGGNTSPCDTTLSVTGLPAGAAAVFGTNPLHSTGSGSSPLTTSFSVTTSASTPVGPYSLQVIGTNGSGCQGQGPTAAAVSLTVNSAVVNTSTSAANATATYGAASVTLAATVAPNTVNVGTVTFTVKSGSTTIGTAVSPTVSAGSASASFSLAGVNAGSYTIQAAYSGGTGFNASDNATQSPAPTLVVSKADQAPLTVTAPDSGVFGDKLTPVASGGSGAGHRPRAR